MKRELLLDALRDGLSVDKAAQMDELLRSFANKALNNSNIDVLIYCMLPLARRIIYFCDITDFDKLYDDLYSLVSPHLNILMDSTTSIDLKAECLAELVVVYTQSV